MKNLLSGVLIALLAMNVFAAKAESESDNAAVSSDYQYEGVGGGDDSFFIALRLGVAESYNVTVKGINIDTIDEGFTGSSVGFRIGYLLDRWTTYLDYNPSVEFTFEKQAVDVESLVLATDYAVWRSANRKHRIAVGGFLSRLEKTYAKDIDGNEFGSRASEADGLSYGVLANYRWRVTNYFYFGGEFQYGLNGVDGQGDENSMPAGNFSSTGIDNYYRLNLLAGFTF